MKKRTTDRQGHDDRPRYKRGLLGFLVYSPRGLLVFPILGLWYVLLEPPILAVAGVAAVVVVGAVCYGIGVNEALLSYDHPEAKEHRRRLMGG